MIFGMISGTGMRDDVTGSATRKPRPLAGSFNFQKRRRLQVPSAVPNLRKRGIRPRQRRGRNPAVTYGRALRGFLRLGLLDGVSFLESFHAARGIHDFLFSRHERVALGADFGLDVLPGGFRMDHISADAGNGGFFIFRMNPFFHNRLFSRIK
jgi:hypothetical protein